MTRCAVILAAGRGSRLDPLTAERPKCLTRVGGLTILQHQLAAYAAAGVEHVVLVLGYKADAVIERLETFRLPLSIEVIVNSRWETTNNMASLQLAREAGREPFLLSNGDVVFDPSIVARIGLAQRSAIAVDVGAWSDESMKVSLGGDGRLDQIAKSISPEMAFGCSVDLYRFSVETAGRLFDGIDAHIRDQGAKDWTELAIDRLLGTPGHDFDVVPTSGAPWVEIDNLQDLAEADRLFSPIVHRLTSFSTFVLDVDGTLLLDETAAPGAERLIGLLRERGLRFVCCTNNSSLTKASLALRLSRAGVPVEAAEIVSSIDATLVRLKSLRISRVFVVGTPALRGALEAAGFDTKARSPELVVVGFDRTLSFDALSRATQLIASGVPYLLTHGDPACPTPHGPVPDAGAIGALLQTATGVSPLDVLGKPSGWMLQAALECSGGRPETTLVVGDRLSTDMRMALDHGCASALLLSGATTRADVELEDVQPDLVLADAAALWSMLLTEARVPTPHAPPEACGGALGGANGPRNSQIDG